MTSTVRVLLCLSLLMALVVGCGPSGPVNDKVTKANFDKIQLEAKLADVEALLGPGQPSEPGPSAKPEDKNLTWKKWQHSPKGAEIIIGFDKSNSAAVIDKAFPQ